MTERFYDPQFDDYVIHVTGLHYLTERDGNNVLYSKKTAERLVPASEAKPDA